MLLFFGVPARRRSWRSMLGMLVLMVILGAMVGCGGGGGGGGKVRQAPQPAPTPLP
jgi:hypothetical protein